MTPYYSDSAVTIYHGDCREVLPTLLEVGLVLTDPPYGISYNSGSAVTLPGSIKGDESTELRDWVLQETVNLPALVFGSWKQKKPDNVRMVLVWDTGGALGMGALDLPWKPSYAEIYVIGHGFSGRRSGDVLRHPPVQAQAYNGRVHPNQKPLTLLTELLSKAPHGTVLDPFMGSGSTLRAAKDMGRKAIGIEIDEQYCETAVQRMMQEVLPL